MVEIMMLQMKPAGPPSQTARVGDGNGPVMRFCIGGIALRTVARVVGMCGAMAETG